VDCFMVFALASSCMYHPLSREELMLEAIPKIVIVSPPKISVSPNSEPEFD